RAQRSLARSGLPDPSGLRAPSSVGYSGDVRGFLSGARRWPGGVVAVGGGSPGGDPGGGPAGGGGRPVESARGAGGGPGVLPGRPALATRHHGRRNSAPDTTRVESMKVNRIVGAGPFAPEATFLGVPDVRTVGGWGMRPRRVGRPPAEYLCRPLGL